MRKTRSTWPSNTPNSREIIVSNKVDEQNTQQSDRDGGDWGYDSASNFIRKTYDIFNDEANKAFCGWGDNGKTIVIRDRIGFGDHVLPLHFKHNNLPSFVRQLNMYGFSKTKQDPKQLEFKHPVFWKGNGANLHTVRRKVAVHSNVAASPHSASNVIVDGDDRPLAKSQQQQIAVNNKLAELECNQGNADRRLNELIVECQRLRNESNMLWSDNRRLIETQNVMSDNIGHVLSLIYDMYMKAGGNPDSHFANAIRMGNSGVVSIKNSLRNSESNGPGAWDRPEAQAAHYGTNLPEGNERKGEILLPNHELETNGTTESQLVSWTGGNALHVEPSFALDGQGGSLSAFSSLPSIIPHVDGTSGGMNNKRTISTIYNSTAPFNHVYDTGRQGQNPIDQASRYRSDNRRKTDDVTQMNTSQHAAPGGPLISQLSMDSGGHGDNELAVVLPEQESQIRCMSSGYGDNQLAIIPEREGQLIAKLDSLDLESLTKVDSIGYQNFASVFDSLPRLSTETGLSTEGNEDGLPDYILDGNEEGQSLSLDPPP